MTLCLSLTRENGEDLACDVEFSHTRGLRGTRDRYGAPEEPDDEEEIEITSVRDSSSGLDVEPLLSKRDMDLLEYHCWRAVRRGEV